MDPQQHQQTEPASSYIILAEFKWGDSNVARYARHIEPVVANGETFQPVPTMEASLKKPMEGGASKDEASISLPLDVPPVDTASRPEKHAEIYVKIFEFSLDNLSSTRTLYSGSAKSIKVSSAGTRAFATMNLRTVLFRLEQQKIGMQALTTCLHTFGDEDCGFDLQANLLTLDITELNTDGILGRVKGVIQENTSASDVTSQKFARGFLRFDGVAITIRSVVQATQLSANVVEVKLDLRQQPPPTWFQKIVTMAPGCNKSIEACRDPFRDREESFLAPGFAMLPYNPAFTDSPGG